MKILFTLGHGYMPQGNGGLQKSVDQLAHELMKKGHHVAVLASLMHGGIFAQGRGSAENQPNCLGRRLSRDTTLGYPVWRRFPWGRPGHTLPDQEIKYVIEHGRPDLGLDARFVKIVLKQAFPKW